VDVEDPAGAGHDLDGFELLLPLLENPRRQTGGVRERPSGDAVLDPYPMAFRHARIVAELAYGARAKRASPSPVATNSIRGASEANAALFCGH
jgi:hypothetical protein